ncbi:sulfotransferase [Pseudomonadota bacterium]
MVMDFDADEIQIGWIAGMPRSGTTWLSQIFASSPDVRLKFCPLFSYEFKNALDESSSASQWEGLFIDLYETNSEFLDQEHLRKHGLVPTFEEKKENPKHLIIKSTRFHNLIPYILRLNESIRFVHIVRHPCATIYSWINTPREFPGHANHLEEWRTGECRKIGPGEFWGFDDWKHVTTQALKLSNQYPDRYKVIRYESLVKNTQRVTEELFQFFQIPLEKQTLDFIAFSQSKHDKNKHSVFKVPKLKERWEGLLDPSIVSECINDVRDTELEQFLDS